MPWPSDQDYNEAVQNPKVAFKDSELQSGAVESYATGIPKARSGNFAAVYKVKANGAQWAVKCFRYDNPEYSRRYPAISAHLNVNRLPYFVSFRYLSQGIRVGGTWYPILKMKWIEGESLISFVERHLNSPAALRNLAESWIRLLIDLQKAGVAHGDLQHGNVLVVGGDLKLVDYDGMYVPALEGSRALEVGHRNYQHPERTDLDFGLYLDNFSAWLVYVSLIALSVRPDLWNELKSGDECLLFRKHDLVAPDQSEAFRLLRAVPDGNIHEVIDQLEEFLWLPPSRVPPISDKFRASAPRPVETGPTALSGWISDHVQPTRSTSSVLPVEGFEGTEIGDPSWIQDHVESTAEAAASFQNRVGRDRLVAVGLYLSAALLAAWFSRGRGLVASEGDVLLGLLAATGSTLLYWFFRYRQEPGYVQFRLVASELRKVTRTVENGRITHEELKQKRQKRRSTYSEEVSKKRRSLIALQEEEAKENARIESESKSAQRQAHEKKRMLAGNEASEKQRLEEKSTTLSQQITHLMVQKQNEMNQLDMSVGSTVKNLESQLAQISAKMQSALAQALKDYQDQIVMSHLHKRRISEATINGIGEELKRRLAQGGYASAADVALRQVSVPGIGAKKLTALYTWVVGLDSDIRRREAPQALPPHAAANIEQRYEASIRQLQNNLAHEKGRFASAREAINVRYSDQKQLLEAQLRSEEGVAKQQTKLVEAKFEALRKELSTSEEQARLRSESQVVQCKDRFKNLTGEVNAEAERLQTNYMGDLENINNELAVSAKHVREITWRREQALRKRAAFERFTFRRYCIRVFSGAA